MRDLVMRHLTEQRMLQEAAQANKRYVERWMLK